MSTIASENLKASLNETGAHLRNAANAAGDAIRNVSAVAGDEFKLGKASVKSELADGTLSGIAAAESGGEVAREQVDALVDKGRELIDSAADLIRERPLVSFGVAFATGWVIAKLARSGGDK